MFKVFGEVAKVTTKRLNNDETAFAFVRFASDVDPSGAPGGSMERAEQAVRKVLNCCKEGFEVSIEEAYQQ